jgi:hypothetical protein
MAYPIKSTAGASSFPVLRKQTYGNLGVNQGGYGLTSSTGFWNGKTPNISGYVVYVGNGSSSPTMYVVTDDNGLITLSNNLGIGTNYNITGALLAFIVAINMICVDVEPPNIVTSGLTLCLDAGLAYSYPRASTIWYDLSGGDGGGFNNGTLVNGPVYASTIGGGSISFDGSDDYVTCGNPVSTQSLTQITMSVWVKFSGLDYVGGTGALNGFMSKGYPDISSPNTGFWFAYDNRSNGSSFTYTCFGNSNGGFAGGVNNFSSKSYTFTNGVWYNITATVNSSSQGALYINGVQQGSSVTFSNLSIPNTTNTLYVGRIDLGYTLNGGIIQTQLYNRALTSAEVLQNYYAGRKRFIPKNGVLLWLDGENTNTRVITPVTAIDVSDNFNDASLLNGTSLVHWDAGTSFYFDGVDNYITINNSSLMPTGDYTKVVIFKLQSLSFANNIMSGNNHFLYTSGGAFLRAGHFVSGQEAISSYTTIVNTWNFAVVTFNSTNGFRIYQNGTTVVGSTSAATASAGGNVILGSVLTGGSFLLQGQIGISMLYNRVLTTSEISDIYLAYKGRFGYV